VRTRIGAQIFDDVRLGHVGFVAQAEKMRKAHFLAVHHVHDPAADGPRLRKKADATLFGHAINEGGVETVMQVHGPNAVRPDQPHGITASDVETLFFQVRAAAAHLFEAARDDDGRMNAALTAGFEGLRGGSRRNDQHRQFHRVRHCRDIGVTGLAQNFFRARVDGVYAARVGRVDEIAQNAVGKFVRVRRSTDDSNTSRFKERGQVRGQA